MERLNHIVGYELFRRAIIERDEDAWAEIHHYYRPLLVAWASQHGAALRLDEQFEDLADRALARAWAALTPGRFTAFPSLAALLAYLRTCVTAAVIDCARAQAARERVAQRLAVGAAPTPEQVVLGELERAELWWLVLSLAETSRDRAILFECLILDIPPRAILAHHPRIFADIQSVYAAKRNFLARLQRNPALRRFYRETTAAS